MLTFRLLGEVVILHNGNRLDQFRSQKEAALLIYLAHTGKSHPRDSIAELLWGDRSVNQMRSNLRTVLARLRGQVGNALLASRTTLSIAQESLQQVDSSRLLQALTGFGPVDSAQRAEALQSILNAHTGDFLADFVLGDAPLFDTWTITTREEIRRQVIAAYRKIAAYVVGGEEITQGIVVARGWIAVDPLDEEANALLIRQLLAQGRTAEAKAHYEQYAILLRAELDVAPPDHLTALVRGAPPTVPLFPPAGVAPSKTRHNLPAPYDKFYGRAQAQQEIPSRVTSPRPGWSLCWGWAAWARAVWP